MRILANDGLSEEGIKVIKNAGYTIDTSKIEQGDLINRIKEYDAIIVRSATKVTKEIIEASNLKVIARAGVGLDNIDLIAAANKNIPVLNTPKASAISVAELSIAQMFAISRFLHVSTIEMKNGKWPKKEYSNGFELTGKTLGLIGYGNIGKEVAKRANGLGMKVIYWTLSEKDDNGYTDFDDLLTSSDIISLHVPFDKEKGALISKTEFAKMKDGAILINCARGGVVNESDLLEALNSGKIRAAGLDVFENEPPTEKQKELLTHEKVCLTPHIGGSTVEAQERVGIEIAEDLVNTLKNLG